MKTEEGLPLCKIILKKPLKIWNVNYI
jgi:hypothetical protein